MASERLDKIIASSGMYSRKEARELVRKGRVSVNDQKASAPERKVDPLTDQIRIDHEILTISSHTYLMLYKPAGVITATKDRDTQTVMDLLPASSRRRGLFPVGRLDKDTEGLLLLTDDGDLAHRLLSPGKHVNKVYYALVSGILTGEDTKAFASGLQLSDGTTCMEAVLEIQSIDPEDQTSEARITIREGKYHQVKRMFAARGKKVLYLKRLQMGPLQLDDKLKKGDFRPLTGPEIESLLHL